VDRILGEAVPDVEVWAFGSRVRGGSHAGSDLDLVLVGQAELDWRTLESVKDAFADSDLPFIVDVIDWHAVDDSFRRIIRESFVVLRPGSP